MKIFKQKTALVSILTRIQVSKKFINGTLAMCHSEYWDCIHGQIFAPEVVLPIIRVRSHIYENTPI